MPIHKSTESAEIIFAKHALLSTGWAINVRATHTTGRIETITPDQQPQLSTGDGGYDGKPDGGQGQLLDVARADVPL